MKAVNKPGELQECKRQTYWEVFAIEHCSKCEHNSNGKCISPKECRHDVGGTNERSK